MIVVDDGSRDGSAERAARAGERVIRHDRPPRDRRRPERRPPRRRDPARRLRRRRLRAARGWRRGPGPPAVADRPWPWSRRACERAGTRRLARYEGAGRALDLGEAASRVGPGRRVAYPRRRPARPSRRAARPRRLRRADALRRGRRPGLAGPRGGRRARYVPTRQALHRPGRRLRVRPPTGRRTAVGGRPGAPPRSAAARRDSSRHGAATGQRGLLAPGTSRACRLDRDRRPPWTVVVTGEGLARWPMRGQADELPDPGAGDGVGVATPRARGRPLGNRRARSRARGLLLDVASAGSRVAEPADLPATIALDLLDPLSPTCGDVAGDGAAPRSSGRSCRRWSRRRAIGFAR